MTVAHAARELGVHSTVLRRWVQESAADASAGLLRARGKMKPEQAELAPTRTVKSSS